MIASVFNRPEALKLLATREETSEPVSGRHCCMVVSASDCGLNDSTHHLSRRVYGGKTRIDRDRPGCVLPCTHLRAPPIGRIQRMTLCR